jgi:hypothetical protein
VSILLALVTTNLSSYRFRCNNIGLTPRLIINNFGYFAGEWSIKFHLHLVADITGDGMGDVVDFGNNGVIISLNDNNTY